MADPSPRAVVHMMKRLRASKNSCSESKVAALTVTVEGGLPSPVSTITDDSAVVRFITKFVTLAHRKSHGPHWSALVERPTANSPASRASAMVFALAASLRLHLRPHL